MSMTLTSPLLLPNVTLVLIETGIEKLSLMALKDTLNLISPMELQLFTDDPIPFAVFPGITFAHKIPPLKSIQDYNNILWHEVPKQVRTSHFLVIQWDGWVINKESWTDDFLNYDYIGAVWPWHKENRVGNGGFSLRSTELMLWMGKHYQPSELEDNSLCREYRQRVERELDFRWANEETAQRFSFEHQLYPTQPTPLGFHDCRNWPRVLSPSQLFHRISLCESYPYITKKPEYQHLKQMLRLAPALGSDG